MAGWCGVTASYPEFLARKTLRITPDGPLVAESEIHPFLHPWQRQIVAWAVRTGRAAVWADTGLGKAQPVDEPVLTPAGWRLMGEMRPGDSVISADGYATNVLGVYPQGHRAVMTVTLTDGSQVRCDADHLWTVATDTDLSRERPWRTLTTRQVADAGVTAPSGRHRWRIPVVQPVQHPTADLAIDPYILGVLLGDGSFRKPGGPEFTVADEEIAAEVKSRLPAGMRMVPFGRDDRAPNYRLVVEGLTNWHKTNPYLAALKHWGLHGHLAHGKFVPPEYLTADPAQRLDLLCGLMDTDGFVAADGTIQFGSSAPLLADGVAALVQSLGGTARRSSKIPTYVYRGDRRYGREHYTLTLRMPNGTVPFLLRRKVQRCRERYYAPIRKIADVSPAGVAECACIAVEHPSQLYVTRDYIVTHNTVMQLEWARLSGRRVLILAPLAVCHQTVREGAKVGLAPRYLRGDDGQPGIVVTNYEISDHFDAAAFDAVVLDESSVIKDVTTKTRDRLIAQFRDVPRRLDCSATPAPNDLAELANHAEFLGMATRREMLSSYFVHDQDGWRVKGHARGPMFRWMASWALAIRRPSDLGYPDGAYQLPGLEIRSEFLNVDVVPEGQLFATDLGGVGGRARVRRATLAARCARAVDLIRSEPGEAWVAWCGLNDEAREITSAIPGAVNVEGSWTPEDKAAAFLGFADGSVSVLVTKPSIAAFGLNWQHCARMTFAGLGDSYESYYQAIRRCWRYGQERPVIVHIVLSELESQIAANVRRKESQAGRMTGALIREMQAAGSWRAA